MNLFKFFKDPEPNDLASELIKLVTYVKINDLEMEIFKANSISVDNYANEKLMMQISFVQSVLNGISSQYKNLFFRDVVRIFAEECSEFVKSKKFFGFESCNEMNEHIRNYYNSGVPEELVNMVFHAIRQQTLIIKDDRICKIFHSSFNEFVLNLRGTIVPHVKRFQ